MCLIGRLKKARDQVSARAFKIYPDHVSVCPLESLTERGQRDRSAQPALSPLPTCPAWPGQHCNTIFVQTCPALFCPSTLYKLQFSWSYATYLETSYNHIFPAYLRNRKYSEPNSKQISEWLLKWLFPPSPFII